MAQPTPSRASVSLNGAATSPSASNCQSTTPTSDGAGRSDRFTRPWLTASSMPHRPSAISSAPGAHCASHLGMHALVRTSAAHELREQVMPQLEEAALLACGDGIARARQTDVDQFVYACGAVREHGNRVSEIHGLVHIMGDE